MTDDRKLEDLGIGARSRSRRSAAGPTERAARDKSFGIRSFVGAWKKQQEADRRMREEYANLLIGALIGQVVAANVFFGLIGFRAWGFGVERWVAQTFLVATFLEVSSLVLIVAKYLFPAPSDKSLEVIAGLDAGSSRGDDRRAGRRARRRRAGDPRGPR